MIIRPICDITIVNGAHGDFIINIIDRGAALIFMFHVIYIMQGCLLSTHQATAFWLNCKSWSPHEHALPFLFLFISVIKAEILFKRWNWNNAKFHVYLSGNNKNPLFTDSSAKDCRILRNLPTQGSCLYSHPYFRKSCVMCEPNLFSRN